MKNVKSNWGSFATVKLQAQRHSLLAIALIVTAMLLPGCSKKAEAQELKGSSAAGSAKTGAYNSESDFQIDWDENVSGGVIITKYIGTKNEVNIPPSIQNNPVTGIGRNAFIIFENEHTKVISFVTKVIIPNTVTSIGDSAFVACTKLTSVTIPNSVTSIGRSAFGGCAFTSITIPNSVTSIGDAAFGNCTSLISITIPDSVTSIGLKAFEYCTSLTSVTIPNSVTSIGLMAFSNCTSLTSVTIPNSVTSIESLAFQSCTSLTSITIPKSVTAIGGRIFEFCTNLISVTFESKITSDYFDGKEFKIRDFQNHVIADGDLHTKYFASDGGPGTYKRFANGTTWKKQ